VYGKTHLAILLQQDLIIFAQSNTENDTRHCLETWLLAR
jgi:hypothetical protein